jgi:hypothetical protein
MVLSKAFVTESTCQKIKNMKSMSLLIHWHFMNLKMTKTRVGCGSPKLLNERLLSLTDLLQSILKQGKNSFSQLNLPVKMMDFLSLKLNPDSSHLIRPTERVQNVTVLERNTLQRLMNVRLVEVNDSEEKRSM